MKFRPLIFSRDMVIADRDGRKTQTRRVMKPQPQFREAPGNHVGCWYPKGYDDVKSLMYANMEHFRRHVAETFCPYGVPGDRLYIKEAVWVWCKRVADGITPTGRTKYRYVPYGRRVIYAADHPVGYRPTEPHDNIPGHQWRLKTARFMPRWACRSVREVVEVRVQRVQELGEQDAIAEGVAVWVEKNAPAVPLPRYGDFARLWDSLNAARGLSWSTNPWVWAITYKAV